MWVKDFISSQAEHLLPNHKKTAFGMQAVFKEPTGRWTSSMRWLGNVGEEASSEQKALNEFLEKNIL